MGEEGSADRRDISTSRQEMKYYRFKTFTTSYFFPDLAKDQQYMYGLYSPYGGRLSQIYWYLFRNCKMVRGLTQVKEEDLPFPYDTIRNADGTDSLMAFNMGSPGVEQKISILGYDNQTGLPFFAKFSQKPAALKLTENEIKVYRLLSNTGLTPQLLSFKKEDNCSYLKAEYVPGIRPERRELTDEILDLCISLASYHIDSYKEFGGLRHSLSHGDFCPWNMLCRDGKIRLIDWELADERPLGYDLLTYICQVSALLDSKKRLIEAVEENKAMICKYFLYFGIEQYVPHLKAFAKIKAKYEHDKGTSLLYQKYAELATDLSI